MALTFHIAATKELAKQVPAELTIDEDAHDAFFGRLELADDAKLLKIQNYHEGAKFSPQELKVLHEQLAKQLKQFNEKQVFTIIYTLASLAEKALKQDAHIFVFSA